MRGGLAMVNIVASYFFGGISGSAWWFNDTKSGMEEQMKSLANLGLLGNFAVMLYRYAKLLGLDARTESGVGGWRDSGAVAGWAEEPMASAEMSVSELK